MSTINPEANTINEKDPSKKVYIERVINDESDGRQVLDALVTLPVSEDYPSLSQLSHSIEWLGKSMKTFDYSFEWAQAVLNCGEQIATVIDFCGDRVISYRIVDNQFGTEATSEANYGRAERDVYIGIQQGTEVVYAVQGGDCKDSQSEWGVGAATDGRLPVIDRYRAAILEARKRESQSRSRLPSQRDRSSSFFGKLASRLSL